MRPTSEELISKYKREIEALKEELKRIEEIKKDQAYKLKLDDYHVFLIEKALRSRKVEIETHLNKCYKQIGKHSI